MSGGVFRDDMTYSQTESAIHNTEFLPNASNMSTGFIFDDPSIFTRTNTGPALHPELSSATTSDSMEFSHFVGSRDLIARNRPDVSPLLSGVGAPKEKKDRQRTKRKVATYLDGLDDRAGCGVCLLAFFMYREYQGTNLVPLNTKNLELDNLDVAVHFAKVCPYVVDYTNYFEQVKFYVANYVHLPQIYEIFNRKIAEGRKGMKPAQLTSTWYVKFMEVCAEEGRCERNKGVGTTSVLGIAKTPMPSNVQNLVDEQRRRSESPLLFMAAPTGVYDMKINANFGDDCCDFFNQIHAESDFEDVVK
jgi:hypothetical protein